MVYLNILHFIILIINCKNFVSLEFYLFIWLKIKVMEQDGQGVLGLQENWNPFESVYGK